MLDLRHFGLRFVLLRPRPSGACAGLGPEGDPFRYREGAEAGMGVHGVCLSADARGVRMHGPDGAERLLREAWLQQDVGSQPELVVCVEF